MSDLDDEELEATRRLHGLIKDEIKVGNIEILEDVVNEYKNGVWRELPYKFNKEIIQAIENLIKEYKELKNKCNELNFKYTAQWVDDNFIAKSKVKEKIEELIKEGDYRSSDNPRGRIHFQKEDLDYKIEVLQELLED